MTPKQQAFLEFVKADGVWSGNLLKRFGKKAGDKRYTQEAEKVAGYKEFKAAMTKWEAI